MPHAEPTKTVEGEVSDVFAHRFVLRTGEGAILADLGPKGAKKAAVKAGDKVKLTGKQTPSELKVTSFERGGETIEIEGPDAHKDEPGHKDEPKGEHKGEHGPEDEHEDDHEHEPADPAAALASVKALGHEVVGEPRRKPKHFEVLAKDGKGDHHEHHVALDGEVKKTKKGDAADDKWKAKAKKPKAG